MSSSRPAHTQFMHVYWHEHARAGMSKGVNPKLHAHKSYSHANHALTLCKQVMVNGLKA